MPSNAIYAYAVLEQMVNTKTIHLNLRNVFSLSLSLFPSFEKHLHFHVYHLRDITTTTKSPPPPLAVTITQSFIYPRIAQDTNPFSTVHKWGFACVERPSKNRYHHQSAINLTHLPKATSSFSSASSSDSTVSFLVWLGRKAARYIMTKHLKGTQPGRCLACWTKQSNKSWICPSDKI